MQSERCCQEHCCAFLHFLKAEPEHLVKHPDRPTDAWDPWEVQGVTDAWHGLARTIGDQLGQVRQGKQIQFIAFMMTSCFAELRGLQFFFQGCANVLLVSQPAYLRVIGAPAL